MRLLVFSLLILASSAIDLMAIASRQLQLLEEAYKSRNMDLFYKLIPYRVTENEKAFPEFTKRIHGVSVTLDSATNRDGRIDAVVKVNKIHTGQITMVKEPRSPTGWAINSAGRMDFEQGKTVWHIYLAPFIVGSNELLAAWGRGC